jgi:predicted porin
LYGVVDAGITYKLGNAPVVGDHQWRLDNGVQSGSRWGIKGTEDLGGGLAARFNVESNIGVDAGTSGTGGTLFDRTATVGFSSTSYGILDLGRQTSVEYDAFGLVDPTSYFFGGNNPNRAYGVLTSAGAGYGTTGSDRQNNSIKYTTPFSGSGLRASLQHGAGEVAGNDGTSSYDGLNAIYVDGGFTGVVALSKMKNALNQNLTLTDIGAKLTIGDVTLKATAARNNATITKRRYEVAGLGVDYAFSPEITFTGAFYQTTLSDNTSVSKAKSNQYIAIAKYSFSKRTNVYATFDYATAKTARDQLLSSNIVGGANSHGTQTSVGVNHSF